MLSIIIQREHFEKKEILLDCTIFKKYKNSNINNRKALKNRIKYLKYALKLHKIKNE